MYQNGKICFSDHKGVFENVSERDWSNFDRENFVLDYFNIDWPNILKLDKKMLT